MSYNSYNFSHKRNNRLFRCVCALLAVAMLCSCSIRSGSGTISQSTSATTAQAASKVTDGASAKKYLVSEAKEMGYANAFDELELSSSVKSDGVSYYRFAQMYDGRPVFGSSVVVAADSSGKVLAVTGNPADVLADKGAAVSADSAALMQSAEEKITGELGFTDIDGLETDDFTDDDVVWWNEDEAAQIACEVRVSFFSEGDYYVYRLLLNADSGELLFYEPLVRDAESVTGTLEGDARSYDGVTYELDGGTYRLYDSTRNIGGYTAVNIGSFFYTFWTLGRDDVEWSGKGKPDGDTVDAYANTAIAYDFFADSLGCVSPSGDGSAKIAVVTGFSRVAASGGGTKGYINNAFSTTIKENGGELTLLAFGNAAFADTTASQLDVVAHEYTHAIQHYTNNMQYVSGSGILMEALSDIFGVLVEAWNNGDEPDWVIGTRNLKQPEKKSLPAKVGDANWIDYSDWDNCSAAKQSKILHNDSTVVSHAAYLMWNGIDGDSAKKISAGKLAALWYSALRMMPSDCTLSRCRSLVELAAKVKGFTDSQRECIAEAFDAVGITADEDVGIQLASNPTVSLYGADGELYGGYTVRVWRTEPVEAAYQGLNVWKQLAKTPCSQTLSCDEPSPFTLELEDGLYWLLFINNADGSQRELRTVNISKNNEVGELEVITEFTAPGGGEAAVYAPYKDLLDSRDWIDQTTHDLASLTAGDREILGDGSYYYIHDIDGDGVGELIIISCFSMADSCCTVYTLAGSRAELVGSVRLGLSNVYINPNAVGIMLFEYHGGLGTLVYLDVQEGELKVLGSEDNNSQFAPIGWSMLQYRMTSDTEGMSISEVAK